MSDKTKSIPALPNRETFGARLYAAFRANDGALDAYCTEEIAEKLYRLTEEMLRVNAYMNITAITEPDEILVKHYADCALIVPLIPEGARLCDIGCGGGFPSLPIAILRPDVRITAVDSTKKKLDYVQSTADLLGLANLSVKSARAEALGREVTYREHFDFVTARAVARMNVLSEWCLPLVRRGGVFLAMKGRDGSIEHEEAQTAIEALGGKTRFCRELTLCDPFSPTADEDAMKRTLIAVEKILPTPKQYPRENAQISKKPL